MSSEPEALRYTMVTKQELSSGWFVWQWMGTEKGLSKWAIIEHTDTEEDALRKARKLDNRLKRLEAKREEWRAARAVSRP